jgi:hypothetical protein
MSHGVAPAPGLTCQQSQAAPVLWRPAFEPCTLIEWPALELVGDMACSRIIEPRIT